MSFKVEAKVSRVMFKAKDSDFKIVTFKPEGEYDKDIVLHPSFQTISIKGNFPDVKEDVVYQITFGDAQTNNFGTSYNLHYIRRDANLTSLQGQDDFLLECMSEKQLKALREKYSNLIEIIERKDVKALTAVNGVGNATAERILKKYSELSDYAEAFSFFLPYGLTPKMITKMCDWYKSADLCIQKVSENPYQLVQMTGVGFLKADEIYISIHQLFDSPLRIKSFLTYLMEQAASNGHTWVTPLQMEGALQNNIPTVRKDMILDVINDNPDIFYLSEDDKRFALRKYFDIELSIADNLARLAKAENKFDFTDWEKVLVKVQESQGWELTEHQHQAIGMMFRNNVFFLEGLAGTGKTFSVKVVLDYLEAKGHSYATTALSGKAANNMALTTGRESFTIHRLLGYDPNQFKFTFDENNPLPYDVVVVDEISMVDAWLFNCLVKAMKTGSKLILIGDSQQLQAIGVGVLLSIINSQKIPSAMLTQIQRQKENSNIVKHSIAIRDGKVPISLKPGHHDFKDIEYFIAPDDNEKIEFLQHAQTQFKRFLELGYNVMNIQLLSFTKDRGNGNCRDINNLCQEIYNPACSSKVEIELGIKDNTYILREGDKVINMTNNYKAQDEFGQEVKLFNGNIGIIEKIEIDREEQYLLIDFEGIGKIKVLPSNYKEIVHAYCLTTHKCVTGDTIVRTSKGQMSLKELVDLKDKNILVYNGEYLEKPSDYIYSGVSDTLKITSKKGFSIEGKLDHRIQVLNKDLELEIKEFQELNIGDNLLISVGSNVYGDCVDIDCAIDKLDIRTERFNEPQILDVNLSLFLGMMVADGTLIKNGFKYSKRYKECTDVFVELLYSIFGKKYNNVKLRPSGDWMAEISSSHIAEMLRKIGGMDSNDKFIPTIIKQSTKENQCAFLKGLFEDGTVAVKGDKFDYIEFSQSTEKGIALVKDVRDMLLNIGIVSTLKINSVKVQATLYIYKKYAKIFMDKIGFISDFKTSRASDLGECRQAFEYVPYAFEMIREIARDHKIVLQKAPYFQSPIPKNTTKMQVNRFLALCDSISDDPRVRKLKWLASESVYHDTVLSIKESQNETYCLKMPESGRFIQNGLYSMNCQGGGWKVIIQLTPFHYTMGNRQMVYTQITRVKEHCVVITSPKGFRKAISTDATVNNNVFLTDMLIDKLS